MLHPNELRNSDGNRCERHRRIREHCGGYLVPLSSDSLRSHHDSLPNDVADRQRNVSDHQTGEDTNGGIKDESEDRSTRPKRNSSDKGSVGIFRKLLLRLLRAP